MKEKQKIEKTDRKPRFNIAEVRASQQAAREELIKFGEAEGRRLALKEGRAL